MIRGMHLELGAPLLPAAKMIIRPMLPPINVVQKNVYCNIRKH